MLDKEELLNQRDHKGRRVITVHTGPNRAERRRRKAKVTNVRPADTRRKRKATRKRQRKARRRNR